MRLCSTLALMALMVPRFANAQSAFGAQDGTRVAGAVLECATTGPTIAVPCGISGAPLKVDEGSAPGLPPGGGSGVTGWLSAIWSQLSGTMNVVVTNLPPLQAVTGSVSVSNFPVLQQVGGSVTSMDAGTAITGATLAVGGSGVSGWLSAIWAKLAGTLSVSVGNWPAMQPVSGTVTMLPPVASVSDCSTTLAVAGTAYQIVSGAVTRKSLLIQNLSGSNAGFSLTSTSPSIGATGTFTLVPNASVQLAPGMATSNPVYATGSAALQVLACTLFQ